MVRFHPRHRPPWWPENEPWPPQTDMVVWRRRRRRFVRRAAFGFALFFFLSTIGVGTLVSMLLGREGFPFHPWRGPHAALALVAALFLLSLVSLTMRRVGFPMGDVV